MYVIFSLLFLLLLVYIYKFNFNLNYTVNRICWSYTSERQIEAMRIAYLKNILRQDISYFDKTGTGILTSQIVSNTQMMQVITFSFFIIIYILIYFNKTL